MLLDLLSEKEAMEKLHWQLTRRTKRRLFLFSNIHITDISSIVIFLRFYNRKLMHLKELAFQGFTLKNPRMLRVDQETNT